MTSPRPTSAEIIAAYLDAVIAKDGSAVDRYFHPDVEYMVNGAVEPGVGTLPPISRDLKTALPWLGLYQGREALKGFLEHMHSNLDVVAFGPRDVITDCQRGAAFGWFRLRARSSGRSADISYAIQFEVLDGRIAKYHFLENTFDVAAAFRAGGAWLIDTDGAQHRIPEPHR